jgi:uncharacterized SAM-binding protein YcdF (DUF218 family)
MRNRSSRADAPAVKRFVDRLFCPIPSGVGRLRSSQSDYPCTIAGGMVDAIVILGSQPDPDNWMFPSHVYESLERAAREYERGMARCIIVSGDRAIRFDFLDIQPPFRECDAMADVLLGRRIPPEAVLRESESRDTVSNFYFIKRLIAEPLGLFRLRFIAANFRRRRIEYLAHRILGPTYRVEFESVPSDAEESYTDESAILEQDRQFLVGMKSGDDRALDGRFFSDPYYEEVRAKILKHPPSDRLFT